MKQEGEQLFVACDFHPEDVVAAAIEAKIAESLPASEEPEVEPPAQEVSTTEEAPKTVQDILNGK
jgi:hypothetical protein